MASSLLMAHLSVERDWTEVPNHLLGLIAERLSVIDYLRFGGVCTCWASVMASDLGCGRRLYLPRGPQSPWLMLPGEDGEFSDTCTFFCVSDNMSYNITSLLELRGKWWVGSTEGWVVTLDERSEIRLLNPLTRVEIQLPPIVPSPDASITHDSEGNRYIANSTTYSPHEFRSFYVRKVVLSSCPITNVDFTAMAIIGIRNYLAFTKGGDKTWTLLDVPLLCEDVIYHKGKFYCLDNYSKVQAWDLSGPSPKMTIISEGVKLSKKSIPFRCPTMKYLVESSGNLLQVWRDLDWHYSPEETYTTKSAIVFQFNTRGDDWTLLSSLGDRCLFVGNSHSMSLSARVIPGLTHNCIHFTDSYWDVFYQGKDMRRDMGVFNLEDKSFKLYQSSDSKIRWPAAVWFTPNLL